MIRPGLVLLVWLCVLGCDKRAFEPAEPTPTTQAATPKIDGWQFPTNAPDDRPVAIRYTERRGTTTEKVGGQGAGLTASGDATNTQVDSSAPTVGLPGLSASGGTTRGSAVAKIDSKAVQIAALVIGTLLLIGGGWGYFKTTLRPWLGIAGVGVCLIAAAFLPGWFWLVAAGLALVLLFAAAYFALRGEWAALREASNNGVDASRFREALRAVVAGVEDIKDDTIRRAVKGKIAAQAEQGDADTIREVKIADNLPAERPSAPPVNI